MYEEQAVADHMDSLYDGGEWSRPARAKLNARAEAKLAASIGARFGLTAERLLDQVWCAAHMEDDRHIAALSQPHYWGVATALYDD
jgi:hypothetical protein